VVAKIPKQLSENLLKSIVTLSAFANADKDGKIPEPNSFVKTLSALHIFDSVEAFIKAAPDARNKAVEAKEAAAAAAAAAAAKAEADAAKAEADAAEARQVTYNPVYPLGQPTGKHAKEEKKRAAAAAAAIAAATESGDVVRTV
jgi:flagellar biosynthesis/type III secretory pathway protein FliH